MDNAGERFKGKGLEMGCRPEMGFDVGHTRHPALPASFSTCQNAQNDGE